MLIASLTVEAISWNFVEGPLHVTELNGTHAAHENTDSRACGLCQKWCLVRHTWCVERYCTVSSYHAVVHAISTMHIEIGIVAQAATYILDTTSGWEAASIVV
jgi:hypothetical protein